MTDMSFNMCIDWLVENTFEPSLTWFGNGWRGWCLVSGKVHAVEGETIADAALNLVVSAQRHRLAEVSP